MPNDRSHIEILSPGNLTTVQDLGRRGFQRFGVSVSGVLDLQAAILANRLVGNPSTSAMLEAMFGGLALMFDSDTKVAVTGATAELYIDEFPMPIWETLIVPAGATLSISAPTKGLYSYIAVAGGIEVAKVLGSRSTHLGSELGGHHGRALLQGDVLKIGRDAISDKRPRAGTMIPADTSSACDDNELRPRVIPGPQFDAFDSEAKSIFFSSSFTISNLTNRQGARLEGPSVPAIDGKHDIVSDPAYMGAVQVPSDGKPIVLLADRQPTGGYAKIASIFSADLPSLVQRPPGSPVTFELADIDLAQREATDFIQNLHNAPLIEPSNVFVSNFQIAGETYNVELVTPTHHQVSDNADGVFYATFEDKTELVATVETSDEAYN